MAKKVSSLSPMMAIVAFVLIALLLLWTGLASGGIALMGFVGLFVLATVIALLLAAIKPGKDIKGAKGFLHAVVSALIIVGIVLLSQRIAGYVMGLF